MSSSNSAEEGAKKLLQSFVCSSARRQLCVWAEDDGNDLYGHLYGDPCSILDSLATVATTTTTQDTNVGDVNIPRQLIVPVQSLAYECTPYLDIPTPPQESSSSSRPSPIVFVPQLQSWQEIPVQVHNSTNQKLRIRWIDSHYQTRNSHTWDLPLSPSSGSSADAAIDGGSGTITWTQYCRPGDFFLLSFVDKEGMEEDLFSDDQLSEETIVGGYRPLRPLPSGKFHSIVVAQQHRHLSHNQQLPYQQQEEKVESKNTDNTVAASATDDENNEEEAVIILESVLIDSYDALCVAAASLDPTRNNNDQNKNGASITIKLVLKIVSNLHNHPNDDKYRTLRLTNAKLMEHVFSSDGALQILTMVGFERQKLHHRPPSSSTTPSPMTPTTSTNSENDLTTEEEALEDFLVCPDDMTLSEEERTGLVETRVRAIQLLEILKSRTLPSFIPELAPPTPWQTPTRMFGADHPNVGRSSASRRGIFISAEERWARAERVASSRRSGRSRRPAPGNAPSSRGNWGR